jgi:hypothetical protein
MFFCLFYHQKNVSGLSNRTSGEEEEAAASKQPPPEASAEAGRGPGIDSMNLDFGRKVFEQIFIFLDKFLYFRSNIYIFEQNFTFSNKFLYFRTKFYIFEQIFTFSKKLLHFPTMFIFSYSLYFTQKLYSSDNWGHFVYILWHYIKSFFKTAAFTTTSLARALLHSRRKQF